MNFLFTETAIFAYCQNYVSAVHEVLKSESFELVVVPMLEQGPSILKKKKGPSCFYMKDQRLRDSVSFFLLVVPFITEQETFSFDPTNDANANERQLS